MSHLLGMSFDAASSPEVVLHTTKGDAGDAHAWGFAWYPGNEQGVVLLKDPMPTGETAMAGVLRDFDRFRGTVYVCHVRGAVKRIAPQDTHPFARSYAGRDWVLAHHGDLDPVRAHELSLGSNPVFEPVGHTDSEHAFCWLLTQIRGQGARRLSGVGWSELQKWLYGLNDLGTLNLLLTDGVDLVAYHDRNGFGSLHAVRRTPPHKQTVHENRVLSLDLDDPRDLHRSFALVATEPLGEGWHALAPGQMIVIRRGVVAWDSAGATTGDLRAGGAEPAGVPAQQRAMAVAPGTDQAPTRDVWAPQSPSHSGTEATAVPVVPRAPSTSRPTASVRPATSRVLRVTHRTTYRYKEPVERSAHTLRLRPVVDTQQSLLSYEIDVMPNGSQRAYEDVFGNQATQLSIEKPYDEFEVVSTSLVRIDSPPRDAVPARRMTIPLVWMPWQRQMMTPYLLPTELPESELNELTDYAMSFVERQDYDLLEILLDMNRTIHRDFKYLPGFTTVETTPFDVYVHRRGVCQDFANLFICLARLLSVPARYRVGYIYTGADYANKLQSEASHAWVECYLPWTGWRGFDPTNGCLVGLDHIRVACGRHFRDATPTSGTIYKGGAGEELDVAVKVEPVESH